MGLPTLGDNAYQEGDDLNERKVKNFSADKLGKH